MQNKINDNINLAEQNTTIGNLSKSVKIKVDGREFIIKDFHGSLEIIYSGFDVKDSIVSIGVSHFLDNLYKDLKKCLPVKFVRSTIQHQ